MLVGAPARQAPDAAGELRRGGTGELGALLRSWRHRALLTQEQLADLAGLNVRTLRRYESGHVDGRPQHASIRLLAGALGLDAEERSLLVDAARGEPGPVGPVGPRVAPAPRQLPAPPPLFTGRAAELDRVERVGDPAELAVVAVDGMAGVGKTAFARQAAHRLAGRYPDGQIHLELHGHDRGTTPVDPGAALGRVLRTLGVPDQRIPPELDDRAALYRSELAGRRMLVLLDDAVAEAQVAPLLPGTAGCLVLITGRRRLTGLERTHSLSLDPLPPADALAYLARAGRSTGDPDEGLAELAELCGRLPLALQIAAARLHSHPSWTTEHVLRCLRDHRHRLAALESGERSVAAALDVSYRRLHPEHRHAYRVLSLHPGDEIGAEAAAALIGVPLVRVRRLVDHLLDVHLLEEPVPDRYRFHDLVRCHAADRAERDATEGERSAALDRLLDHFANGERPR